MCPFYADCTHQQNRCESLKSRKRIVSSLDLCVSETQVDQFFTDGGVVQVMTAAWYVFTHTWSDNKVRELIAVEVLHTSLLNTTVVAFKVLPLGSYAPMPAPSPPFKTILDLVLWNGLQSCHAKHTLHLLTRHCL